MKSTDADRNLLFGVIALQTDAITRTQFADGCALWASQKHRPLADLLAERGWITSEDRADLERLVDRKLRRHDGDVHASLAELVGDVVRHSLAQIDDAQIRRSIARMRPGRRSRCSSGSTRNAWQNRTIWLVSVPSPATWSDRLGRTQQPPSDRVAWPIRPWTRSGSRSTAAIGISPGSK